MFYKGVTKKVLQGGRERQEGEKDDLWGLYDLYDQTVELSQSHWPRTGYSGPMEELKSDGKGQQQWVIESSASLDFSDSVTGLPL